MLGSPLKKQIGSEVGDDVANVKSLASRSRRHVRIIGLAAYGAG
jgi:hypothetical protein